jgi:hypothetical protein
MTSQQEADQMLAEWRAERAAAKIRGDAAMPAHCLAEYPYLGNFAACEPWAARGMSCDECKVSWTGCWDNFQCPQCGNGDLPWCDDSIEPDMN